MKSAEKPKKKSEAIKIEDCFPNGKTPRLAQLQVLKKIEQYWDDADVLVVDLPVASGKSFIAQTVARWALKKHQQKSRVLTPQNLLVDQYVRDFPYLHTLPSAHTFKCTNSIERDPEGTELYSHSCGKEKTRGEKRYCSDCPYMKRKREGFAKPYGVYNYYTYTANKYYRPLLIVDEAHNLISMLKDLNAKKYWRQEYHYPESIHTYGQIFSWVNKALAETTDTRKKIKLQFFRDELLSSKTRYVVNRGIEDFRGEPSDVIKLLPVDVRDYGGLIWPSNKVNKLVLLSATINRKDIESLGLDKRRVLFLSAASPIPADRRPIHMDACIDLSFKHQMENLPKLVQYIKDKLSSHKTKGLIHCTYSLARLLQMQLGEEPRLIWHTKENKMLKYQEYLKAPEGAVLIACGLYEGIDLPDDLGRWQILTKCPYPSLESPAIQHLAETDEEWYANETIRTVVQGVGRICRTPTDWGETFLVDSKFKDLYSQWEYLFSDSFKEAVI